MVEVIAEVGCNHQGDPAIMCDLIRAAAKAGVDAVKGQKRDIMSIPVLRGREAYSGPHSFGLTYGEHRTALEFDFECWMTFFQVARRAGVELFASVFDIPSAQLMAGWGMGTFKIGSGQLTEWDLLVEVASYGRKVYLSTGMSTVEELDTAVNILKGCDLTLFHTTSMYPCPVYRTHLLLSAWLRERYGVPVGWSSHWQGVGLDSAAVALGCTAIEHHFTLDRAMKGRDHAASLEPRGMELCVKHVRAAEKALVKVEKQVFPCEMESRRRHRET